jgi:hypothetical protein
MLTRHLPTFAVCVFAVVVAALTYRDFLGVHRHLWDNATHDRNAHYLVALRLATDAEQFRVFQLAYDIHSAYVWPPLYHCLAAATILVGGRDYRLAVLPNVVAWAGMVVLGFLTVRRAVPRGGSLGGLVAVMFVAASPAHRAYATDIMLESLGACLTLAVVYAYLAAVQNDGASPWPGRRLALALTALFFLKYNYWTLCVLTIVLTEMLRRPREYWQMVREMVGHVDRHAFLRMQFRLPLNYPLAVILLLLVAAKVSGWDSVSVMGGEVSLNPPHTLLTIAYALVFIRVAVWFRRSGRFELKRFDVRFQQLVLWHAIPVALWFLPPRHVSYFLWFLSPANSGGSEAKGLLAGLRFYAPGIVGEYHAAFWCAALAAALLVPAVLLMRRLRPGGAAILILFALGLLLTASHPNQKFRYVHSWIALGWLSAGVGAAALLYGPVTERVARIRPWLSAAGLAALAWALLPAAGEPAYASEGGAHPARLSLLDVTDSYLPEQERGNGVAIVSAVAVKPLAQWTYLERNGELRTLEPNWYGYGPPGAGNREGFARWLDRPTCNTLVFIDRLPTSAVTWENMPETALHAELRDLVLSQQAFRLVKAEEFQRHGCRVYVWVRNQPDAQARE